MIERNDIYLENNLRNVARLSISTAVQLQYKYKTVHRQPEEHGKVSFSKSSDEILCSRGGVTACRCHGRPPEFGSPSMSEEDPPAGTCHTADTESGKA